MMNAEHKEEIQRAKSNLPEPKRLQDPKSRYGAHQRAGSQRF